jgi:hypothetical protein
MRKIRKKYRKFASIFIVFLLVSSGIFVIESSLENLNILDVTQDVSALTMPIFQDDMDPAPLPGWDNTRETGPDGEPRDGQPGINFGNEWQISSLDAYSPPNSWYSGPEELGVNTGGWIPPFNDPVEPFGHVRPLYTPEVDLINASAAQLTFWHRYDFFGVTQMGPSNGIFTWYGDGGMVFATTDNGWTWDYLEPEEEYSGIVGFNPSWAHNLNPPYYGNNPFSPLLNRTWSIPPPYPPTPDRQDGGGAYVGFSGGWVPATFNLDNYVGKIIKIVFVYTQNYKLEDMDGNSDYYGDNAQPWFIDDVVFTKDIIEGPTVRVVGTDSSIINQTESFSYVLNVTNLKSVGDFVSLNTMGILGWNAQVLNYTTYNPIIGDIWLDSGQWIWIRVNVTVPAAASWGAQETTTVSATSVSDPTKSSVANVYTSAPTPDVGVVWIDVPPDRPPNNPIDIIARIQNFGTVIVSFYVRCTVEGDVLIQPLVYNESGDPSEYNYVINLAPGDWIDLTWNFTADISSPYTIYITTLLDIDQNPNNNVTSDICYVQSTFWTWNDIPDGDDDTEFTTWSNGLGTQWEWGAPVLVGPGFAFEGGNVWGTDLNGYYVDDASCLLHTPWFNFSKATTVTIKFYQWFETDNAGGNPNRDRCYFGYNLAGDGDDSINILLVGPEADGGWEGDSGGWSDPPITVDATSFAAGVSQFRFTWWLDDRGAVSGGADSGYYIDNITVFASIPEAQLIITEIVDNDGASNEYIEVYNQGNANATLNDYMVSLDGGVSWIPGNWYDVNGPITVLEYGKYGWFEPSIMDKLDDEGSEIMIVNTSLPAGQGLIHDDIGYGQKGLVPDPVTGESVARYWNGLIYTEDWARETPTSIGYGQIGNKTVYNPLVVLNEVYFNATTWERFIELVYAGRTGDPDVDIDGWVVVVDGNPYTISAVNPQSTVMNATHRLYVVNETMAPNLFAEMTPSGDNVYLYNSTGSLVDLVGWDKWHAADCSISRIPDGYGISIGFERYALDGYDDVTSLEAGWQFINNPTMGVISIEHDQKKVGDTGEIVTYKLTVMNHGYSDTIDLYNQTFGEGWVVEFYFADGLTKLVDTNQNGIPDTGLLAPNEILNITVKINIPYENPGDRMDTMVYAVPANSSFGKDAVTLTTETYPHLEINKSVSPNQIWLNGSEASYTPQEATITLSVRGAGLTQYVTFPQDVVFVIDKSGSMASSDPASLRISAAMNYVDNMSLPDRGAVVGYDDYAYLVDGPGEVGAHSNGEYTVWDLSSQYQDIKDNIDECDAAMGLTSTGAALEIAVNQLIANGNESHVQAIILTTDGMAFDPALAYQQAKRARDNGILIFVIFLDVTGWLEGWWLKHFLSDATGGVYYPTADPAAIVGIYQQIGAFINEIAGRDINVGDTVYMIQDVLPPYIDYVPGTFTVLPNEISVNATGYTFLGWEKQQVSINETWICKFNIRANTVGILATNDYVNSRVNYTKWNNETMEDFFPLLQLTVRSPFPEPPFLRIYNNGTTVILNWLPPNVPDVDHFLIYRSAQRDDFGDFETPWVNTSDWATGIDPLGPAFPVGDRLSWNDTTATASSEYYYIIRTVNSEGVVSFTSNTVGKYDKNFPIGTSTFSLPFEPSYNRNVSFYIQQIGSSPTDYIKWQDPATQTWVTHNLSDGEGVKDTVMKVGEGYEIYLSSPTTYSFWGEPASSLRFLESMMPRPGNFAVRVSAQDVFLSWDEVTGADHYIVYRATSREALNDPSLSFAAETASFGIDAWVDLDPKTNIGGNQFYYSVGAVNSSSIHTCYNTTYSIGVWIGDYPEGYSAIGLPVKTFDHDTKTIDSYCDDIPNTVGINYYIIGGQRWGWHRYNMPMGAYDDVMGYANGYQLSSSSASYYYFIGR